MSPPPTIGLRHDVDTLVGLLMGVGRLARIEDRLGVRSSFYVRARLVEHLGDRACRILEALEDDGWEVGLHLDDSDATLGTAYREYLALSRCGVRIRGVTVHGGITGCRGWLTWRTVSMMGVEYIQGCRGALASHPRVVAAPTIGLDHLVAIHGPSLAVERAAEMLAGAAYRHGAAVLLTHPVYTLVSASARRSQEPRRMGRRVVVVKAAEKLLAALYTLAGRGLTGRPYSSLLGRLLDEGFTLAPLHRIAEERWAA